MRFLLAILGLSLCLLLSQQQLAAQSGSKAPVPATGSTQTAPATPAPQNPQAQPQSNAGPKLTLQLSGIGKDSDNLGSALEIVLLMTLLSLAPAIVMTMTCFTRIVIVLSFLKRSSACSMPNR